MSDIEEKKTAGTKVNGFLEKHKIVLIVLCAGLVLFLVGYITGSIFGTKSKNKDLDAIYNISYEMTNESAALDEAALEARREKALSDLAAYTKKSGVVGVRANMLAAEITYQQKKLNEAIDYMNAAAEKGKKSYTAPLEYYNMGALYEDLNNLDSAVECYKKAAENKDFVLQSHAMFSYARVLETQGKIAEAVDAYNELVGKYPDDNWAKLAKSRVISLQASGKAE